MQVTVFGAGAIGGHIAVRLARGGARVAIVSRGSQLEAFRAKGARVEAPDGDFTVPVEAHADPAAIGVQDLVVVTVKAPGLPEVAKRIGPLLGPRTRVAFVINGIPWWYPHGDKGPLAGAAPPWLDPEGALASGVGFARAIGGVVYSACTVIEPGLTKVVTAENRVIFGAPDGHEDGLIEELRTVLEAGGMGSPRGQPIRVALWTKLLGNLAQGPLSVATGAPAGRMLADPALKAAITAGMREAIAIARAAGVPLEVEVEARMARSGGSGHRASIAQDLMLGRPMEVPTIMDAPLWIARRLGVATPTLDLLVGIARLRAAEAGLYAPWVEDKAAA